jgi:hypothetical protein
MSPEPLRTEFDKIVRVWQCSPRLGADLDPVSGVKAGAIAQNFSLKTPEAKFPARDSFKRGLVIEFLALQFWGR